MASEQALDVVGWAAVVVGVLAAVLAVGAVVILLVLGARWLRRRRRG